MMTQLLEDFLGVELSAEAAAVFGFLLLLIGIMSFLAIVLLIFKRY